MMKTKTNIQAYAVKSEDGKTKLSLWSLSTDANGSDLYNHPILRNQAKEIKILQ